MQGVRNQTPHIMKNFLVTVLALLVFILAGCSKKTEQTTATPQSTPDAVRLKADSERLQQATANAARQREKAAQSAASPTPTASP
jgi:outer membrane murein-binding lipoprotein Lpp